ncbi:hypothetical protein [Streptomyces sp. NPDC046860]|uniref:hypothetical protein n=1 Tax=Streptomyces sp. NPDC046860 TaxID=3154495 RepID=UPI00340AC2B5
MANPGYGKRTAPDQLPRGNHDFTHLPPREAAIAAYIDRLPEGADISVKTLAKTLPYGQCALRTALNRLQNAGHLRRGRERLESEGTGTRWITRSWFSRTARDDAWWAAFARGATDDAILQALTTGLPTPVHHPAALVRRRLTDKLPPAPAPAPAPPRRTLECADCGLPGRPEALPGGMCRACRGERTPRETSRPLPTPSVRARAEEIRAALSARKHASAPA